MLCSATADLSGCASLIYIGLFDLELEESTAFTWDAVYTRCF